jgi:NAD(P)-dependent dehydrogenase (short-subunit alcohol dehydrogenase family)
VVASRMSYPTALLPMPDPSLPRRRFLAGGAAGLAALAARPLAALGATPIPAGGRFQGQVVLITGATSGIGAAAARAFAREGARVVFCGRRVDRGAAVEAEIRAAGGEARYVRADVREEADVAALVAACLDAHGRLDVAFNNAGIEGPEGPLHEVPLDGPMGYRDVMRTNTDGVTFALRYELPVMIRQGRGVIVNTGSVLASRGSADWGAYAASKHAVLGLTRSAARKHAGDGLRVLSISPGPVDTDLLRRMYDGDPSPTAEANPTGRLAQPEEIAAMVLHLASPEASYLNGDDVKVDGGASA